MQAGLVVVLLLGAHPDLEEGRLAVAALKFRAATEALTRVTIDALAVEADVLEAFSLLARAQLALKKPELSQAAFEALLVRAPATPDPEGGPVLRATFQKAKLAVFPPRTVRLHRQNSGPDTLVVDIVNPWRIPLTATWRPLAGTERALVIDGPHLVTALAPGSSGWLEVSNEGTLVASLGSMAAPILGPQAPAPPPVDTPRDVVLTPAPKDPSPSVTPPPPGATSSRRVVGWTLLGVGIASLGVGLGLLGSGAADKSRGSQWPDSELTRTQAEQLVADGNTRMIVSPFVGGVGLASTITGVVVLLTE